MTEHVGEIALDAFSSFNARAISPELVAKSFIPPKQFETLTRRAHTVVVGPRGSGKTTLLKMLTPEALSNIRVGDRLKDHPGVDFTGVFVPTDISWSKQLESFGELGLSTAESESLVESAFNTAVHRAFVHSLYQRTTLEPGRGLLRVDSLALDSQAESDLASAVAHVWNLELPIPSLLGLRSALSTRMVSISRFAARERRLGEEGRAQRFSSFEALDIPLIDGLGVALDVVEACTPAESSDRWALLFDELELAPSVIRRQLLSSLRSVDERFLLKLSISPYAEDLGALSSAISAMPGHDHDEISLSYGRKAEGLDFSLDLMTAVLRSRNLPADDLTTVFGKSDFSTDDAMSPPGSKPSRIEDYATESRQVRYLQSLAATDATFAEYVRKSGGSLESLLRTKGRVRAQYIRKVMPLVIVRSEFRVPDTSAAVGHRRYRPRKNPDVYRGVTSLATILEGNPRWIIGVLNALLDDASASSISSAKQAAEVSRTGNRFRALLTTIPTPALPGFRNRGLLPMVDRIGGFFRERIIADDFTPDPVGSFIVDSNASDEVLGALANALNAGAIVHIPEPGGAAILSSLRGKRFRLSYLLAVHYGLPLRLEREAALSKVLQPAASGDDEAMQGSLFGGETGA